MLVLSDASSFSHQGWALELRNDKSETIWRGCPSSAYFAACLRSSRAGPAQVEASGRAKMLEETAMQIGLHKPMSAQHA
jgi:hypothetical protein